MVIIQNKLLIHVTMWVDLKIIMLRGKKQVTNVTYYVISFICHLIYLKKQTLRMDNRSVLSGV